MKKIIGLSLLICVSAFAQDNQPASVGGGHIPAHGPVPVNSCVPTQPPFNGQHQLNDQKGHPYHPHVDAKDDKWVGHDTCADDPHYHLDHPWAHGHFTGGFGPQRVFTLQVDKVSMKIARWLSVESGRLYFDNYSWRVNSNDYDAAAHWRWAGDQIVIYEDPVHVGWYLAYIPRIGTYAHVEYLGAGDPPELLAEGPVRKPPFENQQVIMGDPHAKMHVHRFNRVMIYGTPGGEFVHSLDGSTNTKKWDGGQVFWVPATPMHYSEIPEETEVVQGPRGLEIGIKNLGEPTNRVSATMDPLRADNFRLEFENDQVRVLRLKIAPEKSAPTVEYALNTVFWYYTDQNVRETSPDGKTEVKLHKAGDWVWQDGPRTVKMDNLSNKPFEAIVVELKD
jgi:hypothetical protein